MTADLSRRGFLRKAGLITAGTSLLIAAPAIVRATSLMAVKSVAEEVAVLEQEWTTIRMFTMQITNLNGTVHIGELVPVPPPYPTTTVVRCAT